MLSCRSQVERRTEVTDKVLSFGLVLVGIIVIALCLLADVIGVGSNLLTIGWKQYSGAAVGVMMIFFGAHIAYHHVLRR
jgi:hypothetical protein